MPKTEPVACAFIARKGVTIRYYKALQDLADAGAYIEAMPLYTHAPDSTVREAITELQAWQVREQCFLPPEEFAEAVFALIELAEDKPGLVKPASVESALRGLLDAIEQGTDCMTNQVDRAPVGQSCRRCGYPAGDDWLDGGETCPKCKLVQ